MPRKIDFINPFGTLAYDDIIRRTLSHYAAEGTELTISHLDQCPADIDYFYSKHLMESVLFERVMRAEEEGFDAVIVGCCYDPGVRTARELVDIPVVGPMEASLQLANYHGHSYTIVTDHHKAAPYIEDVVKTTGLGGNCRGIRTIEWYVRDMVNDPDAVARETIETCRRVVKETNADSILMGCTIVAACFQQYIMNGGAQPEIAIVNPNLMALKMAETLADLKQKGGYHISRAGYYEKPAGHYGKEFAKARRNFARAMKLGESLLTDMADYDAVIVGAGHNGLVCGAYLAKAGLKVCALERRHLIGGPVVSEELWPGYKISTASFVMVLLQPKIMLDLELQKFGLEVIETPPSFQPFPDGRSIIFWREPERLAAEIAKFSQHDAEAYPRFAAHMESLVPHLRKLLFEIPVDPTTGRLKDIARSFGLAWRFRDLGTKFYDIWDLLTLSAHDYLLRWFESPEMLAVLGSYASGSGGNIGPKSPGSAYVLARPYLRDQTTAAGRNGLVRGGMGKIAEAIAKSGARFGLETRTNAEVKRILVEDGKAGGVELTSGEKIRSRLVIANANAKTTFLKLVDKNALPAGFLDDIRSFRTTSTSFKINLAVEQPPRFTAFEAAKPGFAYPGAIVIAPDVDELERAFDAAKYGEMAKRPYLWMMAPSMFDPTIAPPGKHVFSIFGGHVPYRLKDREWDDAAREELYARVMETLAEYAPGFGNSVIHKQVLTPVDLERMFDLPGGHVHHGDLSIDQIFFKRPARHYADYRSPVAGLYQCGASTHPGGGVTGVPGHNAARIVLRDLGK